MPKLSVIIPVYNSGEKLNKCLNSVLEQTFTDFELLLIDDGSTDDSGIICDNYAEKDSRIKVFHLQNGGVSRARNTGLDKANGKYVAFVDSDDYVDKDFLSILFNLVEKNSAEMAFCGYYSVIKGDLSAVNHVFNDSEVLVGENIKNVIYGNILSGKDSGLYALWNKLFRKDIIDFNKLRLDEKMSFGEDMMFVMQYINACNKIVFSDKCLYFYEFTNEGLFSKYRESLLIDSLLCYNYLVKTIGKIFKGKQDFSLLTLKYFNYVNRFVTLAVKYDRRRKKVLKTTFKNSDVIKIFSQVVSEREKFIALGLDEYDFIVPKLAVKGKINKAVRRVIYEKDENCFLRKMKKLKNAVWK